MAERESLNTTSSSSAPGPPGSPPGSTPRAPAARRCCIERKITGGQIALTADVENYPGID